VLSGGSRLPLEAVVNQHPHMTRLSNTHHTQGPVECRLTVLEFRHPLELALQTGPCPRRRDELIPTTPPATAAPSNRVQAVCLATRRKLIRQSHCRPLSGRTSCPPRCKPSCPCHCILCTWALPRTRQKGRTPGRTLSQSGN